MKNLMIQRAKPYFALLVLFLALSTLMAGCDENTETDYTQGVRATLASAKDCYVAAQDMLNTLNEEGKLTYAQKYKIRKVMAIANTSGKTALSALRIYVASSTTDNATILEAAQAKVDKAVAIAVDSLDEALETLEPYLSADQVRVLDVARSLITLTSGISETLKELDNE